MAMWKQAARSERTADALEGKYFGLVGGNGSCASGMWSAKSFPQVVENDGQTTLTEKTHSYRIAAS